MSGPRSRSASAASPRERGQEDPQRPPIVNSPMKPRAPQHRCVEGDVPAPERRQPVEDLHAGRNGDDHRGDHQERVDAGRSRPRPCRPPQTIDVRGVRSRPSTARRPCSRRSVSARTPGSPRDDPHRGQDHDVDLRVPEEPEDVLVEDAGSRRAPGRRSACRRGGRGASSSGPPRASAARARAASRRCRSTR